MDLAELSSCLSMMPGVFMAIKWLPILANSSVRYSPLSYMILCIVSMIHHGYGFYYGRKSMLLLRLDMIMQNVTCILTTQNNASIFKIITLAIISSQLNIKRKNDLYIVYGMNSLITAIMTGNNKTILINWFKTLLVFILSVKHKNCIFEFVFHMMVHNNVESIWHTI